MDGNSNTESYDDSESEDEKEDLKRKMGAAISTVQSEAIFRNALASALSVEQYLQHPGRGNGLWVKRSRRRINNMVLSPYDYYVVDNDRVGFKKRIGFEPSEFEDIIAKSNGLILELIDLPRDLDPARAPDDPENVARLRNRKKPSIQSARARLFQFLMYMRSHDGFWSAQQGAHLAKSSLCDDFYWVLKCFLHCYGCKVALPDSAERLELEGKIEHFPTAILLVDSTLVQVEPSADEQQAFRNVKHQKHGVLHQIAVDYRGRVRHLTLGIPGGNVDATIFRKSELYLEKDFIYQKIDAAGVVTELYYRCMTDCGYLGYGGVCIYPKTNAQVYANGRTDVDIAQDLADNSRIRRARVINEMCIGRLKRWWKAAGEMQRQYCTDLVKIRRVFLAACCLQNMTWELRGYPMDGVSEQEWERRLDWFIEHGDEDDVDDD